jgi:hypothetical protein
LGGTLATRVSFRNGRDYQGEPARLRTFGVVGSDDSFARWQGELQKLLADQPAFQTAVSFARVGGK